MASHELLVMHQNAHACPCGCSVLRGHAWGSVLLIKGNNEVLEVLEDVQIFLLSFSSSIPYQFLIYPIALPMCVRACVFMRAHADSHSGQAHTFNCNQYHKIALASLAKWIERHPGN